MTTILQPPETQRVGRYDVRLAAPADNAALQRLFAETPLPGAITLAFDRLDAAAISQLQSQEPRVWIACHPDDGSIVATYACGSRRVYVNGSATTVPYLSDLRIAPGVRNGILLRRGFDHLAATELAPPAYAQTLVLSQNDPALSLLTSGRPGLPTYLPAGHYRHFAIPTRQRTGGSRIRIRPAASTDIPEMQALYDTEAPRRQFRPVYDFSQLGSPYFADLSLADFHCAWQGDQLLGFAALWDLRRLRQTRIVRYTPWLRHIRVPYNLAWGSWRGATLPAPGHALREATITALTCRDDDASVAQALVASHLQLARGRDLDYIHLGMSDRDPLLPAINRFRRRDFPGQHYLVSFGTDPRQQLDDRPFYFESARI